MDTRSSRAVALHTFNISSRTCLLLILVCLLTIATADEPVIQVMPESETEVVEALLQSLAEEHPQGKGVLIVSETEAFSNTARDAAGNETWSPFGTDPGKEIRTAVPDVPNDLLSNYLDVLGTRARIEISPNIPGKVQFASNSDLELFFLNVEDLDIAWKAFHLKYPQIGAVMRISRVGVLKETGTALLYYSLSCGSLCGNGYLVLLRKDGAQWKVVRKHKLWVS